MERIVVSATPSDASVAFLFSRDATATMFTADGKHALKVSTSLHMEGIGSQEILEKPDEVL